MSVTGIYGFTRNRCSERGCKSPVYRADRCRFHYERYRAMHDKASEERASLPNTPEWSAAGGYVYAVRAPNGLVKIGTAREPEKRVLALQGQSPVVVKLVLVGYIPGNQSMERMIHRRLRKFRSHGEWFHEIGEVKEVVEAIRLNDISRLDRALDRAILAI